MNVPDEDQWDEAICNSAPCQHPQCWASLRRIERGHPRILDPSSRSPRETEDKLPMLTIVNIMDTCFWRKKRAVWKQPLALTFPKERYLLSKPGSRHLRRLRKTSLDSAVTSPSTRIPKLSVLNLNEAKLPFSEDIRNMVVTWVPEKAGKNISSKIPPFSSYYGKKRRDEMEERTKASPYFSERQYRTKSRSPTVIVPPPSPVHLFDQLSTEATPLWTQINMLPQELLKECILAHEKTLTRPVVKIELANMRKSLPLKKDRPRSAVSSKMYLTIQHITLQRPSLRYPEHPRKPDYAEKRDQGSTRPGSGHSKQQQQKKLKASAKKQETKKKAKSETESQHKIHPSGRSSPDVVSKGDSSVSTKKDEQQKQSLRIPTGGKTKKTQEEKQGEKEKVMERQDSTEDSTGSDGDSIYHRDYFFSPEDTLMYETVYEIIEDINETMGSREEYSFRSPSESMDRTSWNPDLKLLRILQTDSVEDDENHLSQTLSEASLEA